MTAALIDHAGADPGRQRRRAARPHRPTGRRRNRGPEAIMTDPVTAADIAELLHHLAALRSPARAHDPAQRAGFLARKAELFTRIADQHAHSDPAYSQQVQQLATDARTAADVNPALTPSPATP